MIPVTPRGFKDVLPGEAQWRESIISNTRDTLSRWGYAPIETPTLEVLEVLEQGGALSSTPFRLFDTDNELLVLRPDVTLQVARMTASRLKREDLPLRFRYVERVYREEESQRGLSRQFTQIGVEAIGLSGPSADAEMVLVLADTLRAAGLTKFKIALGTVGVLRELLALCVASTAVDQKWSDAMLKAFHAGNYVTIQQLTEAPGLDSRYAEVLRALPNITGQAEAISKVEEMVRPLGIVDGLEQLKSTYALIEDSDLAEQVNIDFSVVSSYDYYTGLVVQAYAPGMGKDLGSGGRYDRMMEVFGISAPAAGFAVSLESIMQALLNEETSDTAPLKVAIPKGALYAESVALLARAGVDTTGLADPGRLLSIETPGYRFFIVRPTDVPVFTALGGVDCAICGHDSLAEQDLEMVEMVDLKFGACRFVVAEPAEASNKAEDRYQRRGVMRVATKYPSITQDYYDSKGVQVEIVKLHGNIELAPFCGLADRVVDITATGTTLRENNLVIVDDVLESTARFVGNTASVRTDARVRALAKRLAALV